LWIVFLREQNVQLCWRPADKFPVHEEASDGEKVQFEAEGRKVVIHTGRRGGKQFQHTTQTKRGMKRTIDDYPPKK